MAVYAIGDIQGCFDAMEALLQRIGFTRGEDRLWFTGDLVNRGPQSLDVLRFVSALGDDAICVLGNHDLHLLAVAAGAAKTRPGDTVQEILEAPDRNELLDWLRHRPLLARSSDTGYILVHAGLAPQWDITQATACATEVEQALRADDYTRLLPHLYGNHPDCWDDDMEGWQRLRFISNVFTRMRYCDPRGRLALKEKAPPGQQTKGLLPWFAVPARRSRGHHIVFGHWSALGLCQRHNVLGLDTGCVWGGQLSAARMDVTPVEITSVPCRGHCKPAL